MQNYIISLTAIALIVLLQNCDDATNDDINVSPEAYSVSADDYTFHFNDEMYAEANARRANSEECNFDWSIESVSRVGNVLTVQVDRPKDCGVTYEIISGGVEFSYPPRAAIFVKAISQGCDSNGEYISENLTINMEEAYIHMSASDLKETLVNVRDFCSLNDISCDGECNVTVSDQ